MSWSTREIGDLTGRVIVITGGNSGVGKEAARLLAAKGGEVVLAVRDLDRGEEARADIGGRTSLVQLDLADLDSVAEAAKRLADTHPSIDAVIANGAVMGGPRLSTAQGLERQIGTNHFGHFAFLGRIWPQLSAAQSRVVIVTSIAARGGRLTADMTTQDLVDPSPYQPQVVYSNSKQANLLFAQELHRQATRAGATVSVVAAHPGVSWTNLFKRQLADEGRAWLVPIVDRLAPLVLQSASAGALPLVRAATDPAVPSGAFVGPRSLRQTRGQPALLDVFPQGGDERAAQQLWGISEQVTGVSFPF